MRRPQPASSRSRSPSRRRGAPPARAVTASPPSEGFVFVTVGTTQFDALVAAAAHPAFAAAVASCNLHRVVLQCGRGPLPAAADARGRFLIAGVQYEAYGLKPSLASDLLRASIIVSHAGAGTVYEALRIRGGTPPRLVVAVNGLLADNHQEELAEAMLAGRHCCTVGCGGGAITPATLADALCVAASASFTPLPPPHLGAFVRLVDGSCGW